MMLLPTASVAANEVTAEQVEAVSASSSVAVEVTTPDGSPGLVREDDKAPVFLSPLADTEVNVV